MRVPKLLWRPIAGILLLSPVGCSIQEDVNQANAIPITKERAAENANQAYPNNQATFVEVLASTIRNGNSIADVESALGPGERLDEETHDIMVAALHRWQDEQPRIYVDGVESTDEFIRWPIPDGCTHQLQFRTGKLINHSPESYIGSESS